jgi:DUF1365 family protein
MAHQLLVGRVGHHRDGPARHGFSYPVFFLGLDVDALDQALRRPAPWPWPLSLGRFNLLAFHHRDHGARDGSPLGPWIRRVLADAGVPAEAAHQVTLHSFPRVLGLGFNPVSFWLCRDGAGATRALLAEVSNTFGEHHSYLIAHADGRPIGRHDLLDAHKIFHVSPFFPVQGRYGFRVRAEGAALQVRIDYADGAGHRLLAYLQGSPQPFTSAGLLSAFVRHPVQPFSVLARIHWHALLLWRKGVSFHRKPAPPHKEISVERH